MTKFLIVTAILMISTSGYAASAFDPRMPDGPNSIRNLTCGQFIDMVHNRDPASFEILIWLHGLAAGLARSNGPFDQNFVGGMTAIINYGCTSKSDSLAMAVEKGQAIITSSAKKAVGTKQ